MSSRFCAHPLSPLLARLRLEYNCFHCAPSQHRLALYSDSALFSSPKRLAAFFFSILLLLFPFELLLVASARQFDNVVAKASVRGTRMQTWAHLCQRYVASLHKTKRHRNGDDDISAKVEWGGVWGGGGVKTACWKKRSWSRKFLYCGVYRRNKYIRP